MKDSVVLSCENHLAILTFNRPDKLNVFDREMLEHFEELCQKINDDQDIRVVLIQSNGSAFTAGADIDELNRERDTFYVQALSLIREFNASILMLREMEKPVVVAIQGMTIGIGMSLLLAADLVIASEEAKFSLGYNRIGLSPGGASSYLLPRIVGTKKALELFIMSEVFDANTAEQYGLVNWVVPQDQLKLKTHSVIEHLLNGPMVAIIQTKQLLNSAWQNKLTSQLELEAEAFSKCANTKDFKMAVNAFVNKRVPEFEGK